MEVSNSTNSQVVGGEQEVEVQMESSNSTESKNDGEEVAREMVEDGGESVEVGTSAKTTVSPGDVSVSAPEATGAVAAATVASEADILPSNKGKHNVTFHKGYKYTLHSVNNGIEYNRCAE